jgi:hypothetical protein
MWICPQETAHRTRCNPSPPTLLRSLYQRLRLLTTKADGCGCCAIARRTCAHFLSLPFLKHTVDIDVLGEQHRRWSLFFCFSLSVYLPLSPFPSPSSYVFSFLPAEEVAQDVLVFLAPVWAAALRSSVAVTQLFLACRHHKGLHCHSGYFS